MEKGLSQLAKGVAPFSQRRCRDIRDNNAQSVHARSNMALVTKAQGACKLFSVTSLRRCDAASASVKSGRFRAETVWAFCRGRDGFVFGIVKMVVVLAWCNGLDQVELLRREDFSILEILVVVLIRSKPLVEGFSDAPSASQHWYNISGFLVLFGLPKGLLAQHCQHTHSWRADAVEQESAVWKEKDHSRRSNML